MARAEISMNEIAKGLFVDVKLTGVTRFRVRTWIAIQIIKLAAFILPANVRVEVEQ